MGRKKWYEKRVNLLLFRTSKDQGNRRFEGKGISCSRRFICNKGVDTFLFGSKSTFDAICLEAVTKCKEKHPHIKRIYVRAEFPDIGESYEAYIKSKYDDSFFPERLRRAGRAVYVERNDEMIRLSRYCIIYRNEECLPLTRKSGTEHAIRKAKRQGNKVILFG